MPGIIGKNSRLMEVLTTVAQVAPFNTTVLITGESGTGKELIAKEIHALSNRSKMPFMAVNCGAIPENLMEAELFGAVKGAYTDATRDRAGIFKEADGGSVFLDEIGELPLSLQVKLLRVLQEGEVRAVGDSISEKINIRLIAATNRDLKRLVEQKLFRDDLFFRLNVVSLELPPLRERRDDILPLTDFLVKKLSKKIGIKDVIIGSDVIDILKSYEWPGNIRELENCLEHALVLSDGAVLKASNLPKELSNKTKYRRSYAAGINSLSIKEHTKTLEIELIAKALETTKGNRTHAAKLLEISHRALLYKIKEYSL